MWMIMKYSKTFDRTEIAINITYFRSYSGKECQEMRFQQLPKDDMKYTTND